MRAHARACAFSPLCPPAPPELRRRPRARCVDASSSNIHLPFSPVRKIPLDVTRESNFVPPLRAGATPNSLFFNPPPAAYRRSRTSLRLRATRLKYPLFDRTKPFLSAELHAAPAPRREIGRESGRNLTRIVSRKYRSARYRYLSERYPINHRQMRKRIILKFASMFNV